MNKDELRKELIKIRKNILDKEEKSTIIVNKIKKLKDYNNSKVIALYKPLSNEVNINDLINYSLECGKIVLLPRVVRENIVFIKVDNYTEYDKSNFGVIEPIYKKDNIYNGNIDLVIVPGLGFDKDYKRIGYGKGYYDKFLKNKDTIKIGVCFHEQFLDNVIVNKNDVLMNLVITDKYNDDVFEFFTIKEMFETNKEHSEKYKEYNNIKKLMK